ncbi:histidinol-phosphate transaminase [Aciditerrimonas ferrireducens]|uniref:Histidinol-phosphate aminotransferase n=1 Tax=Aciditerrimonas ferrireducens TaxID=667306 RepID=A0ABV6C371_9ACTN
MGAGAPGGPVPVRPDLQALSGYHSPQLAVAVRLNTNESPEPPPDAWREELRAALADLPLHRYPDREARELRAALAAHHGVTPEEVFCGTGSNEVLQCLLLAYGGPGRTAVTFEPSYAMHRQIGLVTGTALRSVPRGEGFAVDEPAAAAALAESAPSLCFVCSPNNPTGRAEPPEVLAWLLERTPGLLVVDEAYGQFAPSSALELRAAGVAGAERLVVVRTFSKTWAMAGVRLGYLVADPAVVAACELVALPYHLDAITQLAGRLALRYEAEMEERVQRLVAERRRLEAGLARLPVTAWPSDANFVLFRPETRPAREVWEGLLAHSVLVRDTSSWPGLEGCLRVTVGTPEENDRFLAALAEVLVPASVSGSGGR